MSQVAGSKTSVYTGCFTNDWQLLCFKDAEQSSKYAALGVVPSILANRISWFFGFTGVSVNLDSACSSSLVALDVACKGLLSREANMSIVAGSNLILSPDMMHVLVSLNMLSVDGRCFSFDHRANGYSRGDGYGVLVLKRLTDALQDNDTIRAIIRSTASNSDGHTPGITQPSRDSQIALIREAYEKAGLKMNSTRFVEAHGTGTAVGDPVEASAIGMSFRSSRTCKDPLYIGAVKSNIGHLEGASGITGVIKAILVLERAVIPPNASFERLNPAIDAEFLRLRFPIEPTPWGAKGLRRVSVNSFGFGGTNSHAILDDAFHYLRDHGLVGNHCTAENPPCGEVLALANVQSPPAVPEKSTSPESRGPKILVWSARDENGLKRLAADYQKYFRSLEIATSQVSLYLENLAYTLGSRRTSFLWNTFVLSDTISDLSRLEDHLSVPQQATLKPSLGFIFTGQGAQWAGMGRDLLRYAVFERSLRESEEYMAELGCQWRLREELFKDDTQSQINRPEYSQPICTAVQIAIVDLLASFAIRPSAVVGHSSGEIAAAYCCGAISRQSAWRIAYYRGLFAAALVRSDRPRGAMVSVKLSETEAQTYISRFKVEAGRNGLVVACINSHQNITISGEEDQIREIISILEKDKVSVRRLLVDVAYHSPRMDAIASDYGRSIESLEKGHQPSHSITMISSVSGRRTSLEELCTAQYWINNMVSPVRFSDALQRLCAQSVQKIRKKLDRSHLHQLQLNSLVEIGPHSALQAPIRENLSLVRGGDKIHYNSILIRFQGALQSALNTIGRIYCQGYPVDLESVNQVYKDASKPPAVLTTLPEYPFDHARSYWHESRASRNYRFLKPGRLDLLGKPVPDWNDLEAEWRHFIRISEMPWVGDHVINGSLIHPAAGMLVMAIEAINQVTDKSRTVRGFRLRDVRFPRALTIPSDPNGIETRFNLRQTTQRADNTLSQKQWAEFRLTSLEGAKWHENCHGFVQIDDQSGPTEVDEGREVREDLKSYLRAAEAVDRRSSRKHMNKSQLYQTLHRSGFGFGPRFQTLDHGWFDSDFKAGSDVEFYHAHGDEHVQPHVIHPTTLDGILHLSLAALAEGGTKPIPTVVPVFLKEVWISRPGLSHPLNASAKAIASLTKRETRDVEFDIAAYNVAQDTVLARMEGLRLTTIADFTETAAVDLQQRPSCHGLVFKPDVDRAESQQLKKYCEEARLQEPEPVEFYRDLTFLIFVFLSKATEKIMKVRPRDIQPHLLHYIDWAKMEVERFSSRPVSGIKPNWNNLIQDPSYIESLCNDIQNINDQGRVYVTVGRRLEEVLYGHVDPLELLFESGLMRDLYREVNSSRTCFLEFERYLDLLAHKNPNLRILEIGAGTGGTTAKILSTLSQDPAGEPGGSPRFSSYRYTDISQAFFEQAQQDFRHHRGRMSYGILDIELNPTSQGYENETYDLIIAANVLHATKDIDTTMKHVRQLLRPGGKLMMYEPTRPEIPRTGFVAGLLSGWWRGVEDYRRWSPTLTSQKWHEVLSQNSFSGIDLELPDFVHDACQEGSIIVTTAMGPTEEDKAHLRAAIIMELSSTLQKYAAEALLSLLKSHAVSECEICSLEQAASMPDVTSCVHVFLLELDRPLLYKIVSDDYAKVRCLLSASRGVLWVTSGGGPCPKAPEFTIIDGLLRAVRNERPSVQLLTLALETDVAFTEYQLQSLYQSLIRISSKVEESQYEPEYVERNGLLHIPRTIQLDSLSQDLHMRSLPQQSTVKAIGDSVPLKLALGSPGLLDTLHFIEDKECSTTLEANEVEIQVHAIGMNFKDCLVAMGKIPGSTLGLECAGTVSRTGTHCGFFEGDRVLMYTSEAFKTFSRAKADHVFKIPSDMTFHEAASIPAQFGTAWQVVHEIARIKKGETILIHSAAGGTGQAAIQIAQLLGAEVFATVGSNEKKHLLMEEYGIAEDHIFYSRDTSFAQGIRRMTRGRGVDVVMNSLSGEGLLASWKCIAPYGRFVEIGKQDILSDRALPMLPFLKSASFTAFDGVSFMSERPERLREGLQSILSLFATKQLHVARPLHVYGIEDVEKIFRQMQDGKTAGKFVIEVKPDAQVPAVLDTRPSFLLDSKKTYLIVGGLGGLGRRIARWMIDRGAANLVLLSRSGGSGNEAAQDFLTELRSQGIRVEAPPCDVADEVALKGTLDRCALDMPPIKGCIQGSMVLRDSLFEKMSYRDWKVATDCKTRGSWNLHYLLPPDLEFFVMLSSVSGVVGLRGQANYAAGNTFMDGLARYRVSRGQKAVTLDLGAMTEDGLLSEDPAFLHRVLSYGTLEGITRSQFSAILDHYCNPALPLLTDGRSQVLIGLGKGGGSGLDGLSISNRPMFNHLRQSGGDNLKSGATTTDEKNETLDFKTTFLASTSLVESAAVVTAALIKKLSHSFPTLDTHVDARKPLHSYGVDSLLAVELRTWLAREFGADVPVFEILGASTFESVGLAVAARSEAKRNEAEQKKATESGIQKRDEMKVSS